MSDVSKIVIAFLGYAILFSWSISLLAVPAAASEYVGNFERIPLVENRPPKVGKWKLTPTVLVCENAPVNKTQIKSAVDFWKELGYNFFRTQYKYDPLDKCRSKAPKGYIVIHLVTQGIRMDESSLAQTHFYVDNVTNEIEWAIIYMRSDIRETVLEHEIGHALGFLHYNMINHLMNQKWTMGGWDKEGLERARQ
jgi:hypothetical protein